MDLGLLAMDHPRQVRFDAPMTTTNQTTAVLGGHGKTGRRVVQKLTALGVPVRVGSRSGTPPFDWDVPASWGPAFAGVGAVYLTYQPDLSFPGAAARVADAVTVAADAGVRRVVLLSGRNEDGALAAEAAVRGSGLEWTVVRSSFFNQNFSESFFVQAIVDGTLAFPAGSVREPFIDADDIADVAVAAFTDDRHVGQLYDVTGPRLLTFGDAVEAIAAAAGRRIDYLPISIDAFAEGLRGEGLPEDDVAAYAALFAAVLDGRNAHLTDGVERALGRPPLDFRDYAEAAAATGVWNATATAARA
jgi:uncharacterized protein YbjT (DUF2867 family)